MEHVRAALFVDFDNLFIGLGGDQRWEARSFGNNPQRWLAWLTAQAPLAGVDERRVLLRRCYLNPISFGNYRTPFINAGFEVIDCPPLTAAGKTSADIHMAIDMLDALQHATRFDEFIVMSADSDFTPILLRLRAHDRRTLVVSGSQASRAYQAACDYHMTQIEFVEGLSSTWLAPAAVKPVAAHVDVETLKQLAKETVATTLANANDPVILAVVADRLNRALGKDRTVGSEWGGYGNLKTLLESLKEPTWQIVDGVPGYIYDSSRHDPPQVESLETRAEREADALDEDIRDVARRVSDATGVPLLSTAGYSILFTALAEEVNENGYRWSQTSKRTRDRCMEALASSTNNESIVARSDVDFVLQGLWYQGERFRSDTGRVDANALAELFVKNVEGLSAVKQVGLNEGEREKIARWILGAPDGR